MVSFDSTSTKACRRRQFERPQQLDVLIAKADAIKQSGKGQNCAAGRLLLMLALAVLPDKLFLLLEIHVCNAYVELLSDDLLHRLNKGSIALTLQ